MKLRFSLLILISLLTSCATKIAQQGVDLYNQEHYESVIELFEVADAKHSSKLEYSI